MLTTILTIISALIGLVGGVLERRYSTEEIKKRSDYERDEELANQDSPAIGKRLSDLRDRMRKKNRSNTGQ